MMEFKQRVQDLVAQYEEQLSVNGITIQVSKRYFETEVQETSSTCPDSSIMNAIEQAINQKREKEKGYHYQRNKFHCIILTVCPVDKGLVKKEHCREYAFLLRKKWRINIGDAPIETAYQEDKVLQKIEKRIQKLLQKAEAHTPQAVCKDTWRDIFRYTTFTKYEYKTRILDKDRSMWELLDIVVFGGAALLFVFILWLIYG